MTIAGEHRSRCRILQWAVGLTVVTIGLAATGVGGASPKLTVRKQMAAPIRISIPAIRVNARIIPLGLNRDQTLCASMVRLVTSTSSASESVGFCTTATL
jgi:hypothetical protein